MAINVHESLPWTDDVAYGAHDDAGDDGAGDGGEAGVQGLTLVHFSAQLERVSWDRGCA